MIFWGWRDGDGGDDGDSGDDGDCGVGGDGGGFGGVCEWLGDVGGGCGVLVDFLLCVLLLACCFWA